MLMRIFSRRPSPAPVMSALALFIALGGTTYAATGGNWILGQPNTASSRTSLSAPIPDRALQISNVSTAAGAGGIGVTVGAGKPPLIVNSAAGKATNLNADKLDGVDSAGFWKLGGNAATNPAAHFLGTTDSKPLNLRVNNARALRLEPASDGTNQSPNVIGGSGDNSVTAGVHAATIAGGGRETGVTLGNRVTDNAGTVGGGANNRAGNANVGLADASHATRP